MKRLDPFLLEDFHATYEHRSGLLNLATSDAEYWKLSQVRDPAAGATGELDLLDLRYPDLAPLNQVLTRFAVRVPDSVVIPTSGAGEAIFLALGALGFRLGGVLSVAVPRPAFGAFEGVVNALGHRVEPYYYRPQHGWLLDTDRLLECARTCDVVVVNSPHNPTGAVLDPDLLSTVGQTLRDRGRYLLSDEVFLLPEDTAFQSPLDATALAVGSLSKLFGMPGLRLGWLVTPRELVAPVKTLQQYTTLSLNAFAAGLGASVVPRLAALGRAAHLDKNRQILHAWAKRNSSIVGLSSCEAGTTTILEVHIAATEQTVFDKLLAAGVLLAPGRCFGVAAARPWFRLGYGGATDVLEDALRTIERVLTGDLS